VPAKHSIEDPWTDSRSDGWGNPEPQPTSR
jgi:hypothetical protein